MDSKQQWSTTMERAFRKYGRERGRGKVNNGERTYPKGGLLNLQEGTPRMEKRKKWKCEERGRGAAVQNLGERKREKMLNQMGGIRAKLS